MPGAPGDAHSTTRASMASTEAYARGDYGRGDADADVNRAPSPMGTMTTSKDEVDAAPPMGCCAKMAQEMEKYRPQRRAREVYGPGEGCERGRAIERDDVRRTGCFGPSRMLGRADRTRRARS